MIQFRPPQPADLDALAETMRAVDRIECSVIARATPRDALRQCVDGAEWTLAAFDADGVIVTAFGVTANFMGDEGFPWMLSANGIERYAKAVLTFAPRYVADMRERFQRLSNVVHADNRSAIRFLRWLGFEIGKPMQLGGHKFYAFEWRAQNVEAA